MACDNCAINLTVDTALFQLLLVGSMTFLVVSPIYSFFVLHEYELPIPIVLPFVDPDAPSGFKINLVNQITFAVFGSIVVVSFEFLICMLKNSVIVTVAAINCQIEELDESLTSNDRMNIEQIKRFHNVLVQIQDFDRYVQSLTNLFYWKFLLVPILFVYSVASSLFLFMTVSIVHFQKRKSRISEVLGNCAQYLYPFHRGIGMVVLELHSVATCKFSSYVTLERP